MLNKEKLEQLMAILGDLTEEQKAIVTEVLNGPINEKALFEKLAWMKGSSPSSCRPSPPRPRTRCWDRSCPRMRWRRLREEYQLATKTAAVIISATSTAVKASPTAPLE